MGLEWEEKWLQEILKHSSKQRIFGHNFQIDLPKWYLDKISNGVLELEKQNAMYVGLPKVGRKLNLNGKIIDPLKLTQQKARSQITILNDALLERTLGKIKGTSEYDSESVSDLIDEEFLNKLLERWKYISARTQRRLRKLEGLEDSID